jgi:hypothetical protein
MRDHLKQSIKISPGFPESYNLLAFINMVTGEELDESANLLRRAISLSPSRHDFVFMLAQIQMRQQKFDDARKMLDPLAKNAPDPQLRQRAQSLLDSIQSITERSERFKTEADGANVRRVGAGEGTKTGENEERPRPMLRRRAEGEKIRGLLTEIECSEKGMTLVIKDGERTLKFNSSAPERLEFITFSQDAGQSISCGKVNPARPVIVTYRGKTDLLASLKHFLANEWDRAQTQKRGGGISIVPMEMESAEEQYIAERADYLTPEKIYERRWALTLIDRVFRQLEKEFEVGGAKPG